MTLPLEKPFYLYSLNGASCQIVKGATLKEESVNFDKKDRRYHTTIQGETPFGPVKDGSQMKLTYCYYTPGKVLFFSISSFENQFKTKLI